MIFIYHILFFYFDDYAISRAAYTQFYVIIYALGGISGDGSQLTSLNASNVSFSTSSISRGAIGTTTLNSNQILIGNAATSILQSASLTWIIHLILYQRLFFWFWFSNN